MKSISIPTGKLIVTCWWREWTWHDLEIFLVVNKHFNGTIIANCLQLHDGDQFTEGPAICNRSQYRTSCACITKNHCNSPTSPIADFRFVDEPILEGYQLTPLISIGGESLGGRYQFVEWIVSIWEAVRSRLQQLGPISTLGDLGKLSVSITSPHVQSPASYTWVSNTNTGKKNGPHSPDPERAPNFAALSRTSTERLLKSQGQWKLPGSRTMATICTYNARTLASEFSIEDLLMQARTIRYDVIGLAETRRRHPFNAVYDTGEELFFRTRDSRGVGGVGVVVNTSLSMNIE
uniref:Endo/exonuclease/phosphatase domain-containing protein n=1 Tax=Angiostrongylus cantonensis TaxID=6313 RepID=A0A0K0DLI4_ANGCA